MIFKIKKVTDYRPLACQLILVLCVILVLAVALYLTLLSVLLVANVKHVSVK
jgi:hypothetical protein